LSDHSRPEAHRLCDFDQGGNTEMAIEIAWRPSGHNDDANFRIAGKPLQGLRQRIAHRLVKVHSFFTAQCNDGDPMGYLCR
jgi:hypothetical protein